jgi:hypothetical protein
LEEQLEQEGNVDIDEEQLQLQHLELIGEEREQ